MASSAAAADAVAVSASAARALLTRVPVVVRRTVRDEGVCRVVYACLTHNGGDAVGVTATTTTTTAAVAAVAAPTVVALPYEAFVVDANKDGDDASSSSSPSSWSLVYDVMRVRDTRILFARDHLRRIADSYRTVAGAELSQAARTRVEAALTRYAADARARDGVGAAEQNVKFVAWLPATATTTAAATAAASADEMPFVAFFMRSFYPPEAWYATGTTLALLYDAARSQPNAKVVQSTLRARATALQQRLGVYEVLLVHDAADGYVIPEGSRSNYLLVMPDHTVLCSAREDILIGVTLQSTCRAIAAAGLGAVQHRRLTLKDVCACKSVVMLGTSVGVLPVRQLVLSYDDASERALVRMAAACLDTTPVHAVTDVPRARVQQPAAPTQQASSPSRTVVIEFDVHDAFVQRLRQAYETAALE